MLFVLEGTLQVEFEDGPKIVQSGDFLVYSHSALSQMRQKRKSTH